MIPDTLTRAEADDWLALSCAVPYGSAYLETTEAHYKWNAARHVYERIARLPVSPTSHVRPKAAGGRRAGPWRDLAYSADGRPIPPPTEQEQAQHCLFWADVVLGGLLLGWLGVILAWFGSRRGPRRET